MLKKRVLALLLALATTGTLVLTGCGGNGGAPAQSGADSKPSSTADDASAPEASSQEDDAPAADPYPTLENGDITILWHTTEETHNENMAKNPDTFDAVWSVKAAFEEKYGGTVTVNAVPWGDMKATLISMVSTGEVCDLAQANDQNFPIYPSKKLIQPVDTIVDLNDELWYDSVTKAFTFGGEPYAMGTDATSILIYYNKTLFENYSEKTPEEYYADGEWNWENFRKAGMAMTDDTTGDGEIDQYGFDWWGQTYQLFLASNGLPCILYGDDGSIQGAYDQPQAVEALQFLQNAYVKDAYVGKLGNDAFVGNFRSGKLAMTCEYGMLNYADVDFELGVVPFPAGPNGKQDQGLGGLTGWSIPVTAGNTEGAAAFAYMSSKMTKENVQKNNLAKFSEEEVARYQRTVENIVFSPIGIDKFWDANATLFTGLTDGTPVATFAATAMDMIKEGAKTTLEQ